MNKYGSYIKICINRSVFNDLYLKICIKIYNFINDLY